MDSILKKDGFEISVTLKLIPDVIDVCQQAFHTYVPSQSPPSTALSFGVHVFHTTYSSHG